MDIKEALEKAKYPEDKIIGDDNSTDPEILNFNLGWNELCTQLIQIANQEEEDMGKPTKEQKAVLQIAAADLSKNIKETLGDKAELWYAANRLWREIDNIDTKST